jgi:hypothetical protein
MNRLLNDQNKVPLDERQDTLKRTAEKVRVFWNGEAFTSHSNFSLSKTLGVEK